MSGAVLVLLLVYGRLAMQCSLSGHGKQTFEQSTDISWPSAPRKVMVAVPSLALRCVRVFTMSLHIASAAYTLVQWPLPLLGGGARALVLHTPCRFLGLSRHPFIPVFEPGVLPPPRYIRIVTV